MVSVDQVINIYDPNILWYRIPGFPGYEICKTTYMVRSFKSRKKYPYGTLVKWNKNQTITLTNHNNQRVNLTFDDIIRIVDEAKELPNKTIEVQGTSRNPLSCIDTNAVTTVGKIVAKPKIQTSEEHHFVNFDNIPDIIID